MEAATKMTTAANGKTRNLPLPWLNLVVTEPCYLLHLLVFFSYFAARSSASQTLSSDLLSLLLRREIQAILTFLVLTAVKMVREETWEAFIADTLFYAKGLLLAVASIIGYHLALCYLVGFLVIFALTQQPPYDDLGDSSHLTPLQLETILTEGNTSRFWLTGCEYEVTSETKSLHGLSDLRTHFSKILHLDWLRHSERGTFTGWQVEFRALCSSTCIRTSRVFPDLSIIYSNKNISFGMIDLGHFPNAAEKFGISLNGQLPAYILFDNAVEVARLPDINNELSTPTITKTLLCRHFELDRHLIEYISRR